VDGARVVGVSPMVYLASRAWPEQDHARYLRYLDALAAIARAQLDAGHRVVLFGTDGQDEQALDDLEARLADLPAGARSRVERPPVAGVSGLLELIGGLDAVVASRLHGVILTHVAGRPCLALSYERKVRAHMHDFDEEAACLDIEGLDPAAAADVLGRMLAAREESRTRIADRAARWRAAVDAQYDAVLGGRA
jgi:polysaccharide pyruvyl transferase WcaK-like protein